MNEYIRVICKIGQGAACCKYLAAGTEGMECMKVKEYLKEMIDDDWVKTVHVAQGDNCEGQKNLQQAEITENEKK